MSTQRVYVAGHRGLVGGATCRALLAHGGWELVTRTHQELDLTEQSAVRTFFERERIDAVVLAAARVGGIVANSSRQYDFLYDNMMIAANVINAAAAVGVPQLQFLGSSCIYPREAPNPITEDALLTSRLEKTNEGYAVAKIAGLKLCQFHAERSGLKYYAAMPCNLYGPGDNFHPEMSHVIPGLMRRLHQAAKAGTESTTVWGTGKPRREFLFVEDLADALTLLLDTKDVPSLINVGAGTDVTIQALAETMAQVTGFRGRLVFDSDRPDGTMQKLMDSSAMQRLGWAPKVSLQEGLERTHRWAVEAGVFNEA